MRYELSLSNIISETARSIRVALPLIASELIFAFGGFFATILLSDLGNDILAAHSLAWNIYFTVIVFSIGVLFSVSILVSQSFGARDNRSIRICFSQGILLAIVSSPIMMLITWFCPIILVWTGQDPTIVKLATEPLRSLAWTMLPLNIIVVMQHFLMGINKAYLVTMMSAFILPLQIFFFYIFLFGKFGFPKLGLAGVGYGITASYYIVAIPFFFYLLLAEKFKQYELNKKLFRVDLKILFEFIRLGLPLGFLFSIEMAFFAAVAIMMGRLGTNILAAYQISYQYLMIGLVILFALIQATTVRVGTEVGRNDRRSLRLAAIINFVIALVLMSLFGMAYIYFPKLVIGVNIDVKSTALKELVTIASEFLFVIGILVLANCIRLISTGALRGVKDINIPTMIVFAGFWLVAFPCSYLLGFEFGFKGVGILWGIVVGVLFSGLILLFRFNKMSKHINLKHLITKAERQNAS